MESRIIKNTNHFQYRELVDFMKKYPDIARNNTQRSPVVLQALWTNLRKKLNSLGPPRKDLTQWRKVWFDYKSFLKKKLSAQMKGNISQDGKPSRKKLLNPLEEEVIELVSLRESVQTMNKFQKFQTIDVSTNEEDECEVFIKNEPIENEEIENTDRTCYENNDSNVSPIPNLNEDATPSQPKTYGVKRKYQFLLEKQVDCQEKFYEKVSSGLSQQNDNWQDNNTTCKDINKSIKKLHDENKITNRILQEQLNEIIRHNKRMEELTEKKNEIKAKILQLKLQKLKELKK